LVVLLRCHKRVDLKVPEAKDCARAAALGLEYKMPRAMKEFSIQRDIDEAVDKMTVSTGLGQPGGWLRPHHTCLGIGAGDMTDGAQLHKISLLDDMHCWFQVMC
jgi:hypothetical protein